MVVAGVGSEGAPTQALTLRAVLSGVLIGAVLAVGNVYMGLKTGWWNSGNITAAVVAFALFAPGARLARRRYSVLENNVTQTTAGSAAVMPVALGLLGAVPALEGLGHRYSGLAIGAWGLCLAMFGILLGARLRARYVVAEPLPFPSAIAAAEVIRAIHTSSAEARARTRLLLAVALLAALVTWFRDGVPRLLPGAWFLPVSLLGVAASTLTLGLGVSPMLVSTGILVGARNGASLLVGAVLAWAVLAPRLVTGGLAASDYGSLVGWLLWPAVGMMVASGLTGLVFLARAFGRTLRALLRRQAGLDGDADAGGASWAAVALAGVVVVLLSWWVFDVHPVLGAISVVVSVALIDLVVRTAGETDIAPVAELGQLGQLVLGLTAPGRAPINVACASVTAGAGVQSALTVIGLKTAQLLNAPAGAQLRAQILGAVAGALVAVPAYALVTAAHPLGSPSLPAPAALAWQALAQLAARGAAAIPPDAGLACLLGGAVGVALTLLERTRAAPVVPSPVALAAAFLVPASTAVAVALGALAFAALAWRRPALAPLGSSIAAGGIAGESLLGFAAAVLATVGLL